MSSARLRVSLFIWTSGHIGVSALDKAKYILCTIKVLDALACTFVYSYIYICIQTAVYNICLYACVYYRYSQGTGRTWLDNVQCTSSDIVLSNCTHNGFGIEDCSHIEDIAVSCSTYEYHSYGKLLVHIFFVCSCT